MAGLWDVPAFTEHAGYQHSIEVNLTPLGARRHLGAQFREHVGLPPKVLARIVRFDRVVTLLRHQDPERWAEVAYDCGYYDQAHFNRDFRQFAGATPTAFLASRLPDGGGFEG